MSDAIKPRGLVTEALDVLAHQLINAEHASKSSTIQNRVNEALANVKRARAYADKALATLQWAEYHVNLERDGRRML